MKSSDFYKKTFSGGNVFRILESKGFIYDPNKHQGAVVLVQTEGFGYMEVNFASMTNGDTIRIMLDYNTTIYDTEGKLIPSAFDAIGIVDFVMMDNYVYASVPSAAAASVLSTPAMLTKISAVEERADIVYETMTNKIIESPMINDPNAEQASFGIPLADTTGTLNLTAIKPGESGNDYTMRIVNGSTNEVVLSGTDILIVAATGCTCYEMYREIMAHAEIPYLFVVSYEEADADKLVEEVNPAENFANGVDGHVLAATAEQIDKAITKDTVTVIDLSTGGGNYQIETSGVYVVTNNKLVPDTMLLPATSAGTVGMRITVSNQDDVSLDVVPYDTDGINGENAAFTVATTESITLVCYDAGKWAIV